MSDLHSKMKRYRENLEAGGTPEQARRVAGITREQAAEAVGAPEIHGDEEKERLARYGATAVRIGEMLDLDPIATADPRAAQAIAEMSPDDPNAMRDAIMAENGNEAWWKSGFRGFVETVDAPLQLITHAISGENWRGAVPSYMRKEEWEANPEYDKKRISLFDAADTHPYFDDWIISSEEMEFNFRGEDSGLARAAFHLTYQGIPDIAADPLTYATGIGIGSKVLNLARKYAPLSVKASAATRIAAHTGDVDDLLYAKKIADQLAEETTTKIRLGDITGKKAWTRFKTAKESQKYLESELAHRLDVDDIIGDLAKGEEVVLADRVPHARAEKLKVTDDMSPLRKQVTEDRIAANTEGWVEATRPRVLDKAEDVIAVLTHGPDRAEHTADTIARIAAGADHADDVFIHTGQGINGTRQSTTILPHGVGVDGRVMQTRTFVDNAVKGLEDAQDTLIKTHDILEESVELTGKRLELRAEDSIEGLTKQLDLVSAGRDEVTKRSAIRLRGELEEISSEFDRLKLARDEINARSGILERGELAELEAKLAANAEEAANIKDVRGQRPPMMFEKPGNVRLEELKLEAAELKASIKRTKKSSTEVRKGLQKDVTEEARGLRKKRTETKGASRESERTLIKDIAEEEKLLKGRMREITKDSKKLTKTLAKDTAEEAKDIKAKVDKISEQIAYIRDTGELPKDYGKYSVKWPGGPRREIIDSFDFVDKRFGELGHRILRRALYPRSYVARPMFLHITDRFFGEAWRVLDNYAPKVSKRIFGGMRDAEISNTRSVYRLTKLFEHGGIYKKLPEGGPLKMSGAREVVQGMTVDKDLSRKLWDMLDTKAGTVERELAEKGASKELLETADGVRKMLAETADDLGLTGVERIEDYIHHMVKQDHFSGGNIPVMFQGGSVRQRMPGFLKTRTGNGKYVVKDAAEVLDYYYRGVAHELHIRPMMQDIKLGIKEAIRVHEDPKGLTWLAGYGDDIIERLMGKPSLGRRVLNSLSSNPAIAPYIANIAHKGALTSAMLAYSSVLAGSMRYFMMSIAQAINSTGPRFGPFNTLRGLAKMTTPEGQLLARASGAMDETAKLFEGIEGAMGQVATKTRLGAPSIRDAESFIRGTSMHASIGYQLRKMGVDDLMALHPNVQNEVVAMAMRDTRSVNHVFGFMGKPLWFNKVSVSGSTVVSQFSSFPMKQMGTMYDGFMRNPGYLTDYMLYAGFLSKVADKFGIDLDPYIGVPDVRQVADGPSIPVTFMVKTIAAVQKHTSMSSTESERRKARQEFDKASDDMMPFLTAMQRWSQVASLVNGEPVEVREDRGGAAARIASELPGAVKDMVTGDDPLGYGITQVSIDKGGSLIRTKESSLAPASGKATSVFAILTQMGDVEGRIHKAQTDAVRKRQDQRETYVYEIADEFARRAETGEPVDEKKVTELLVQLRKIGVEVTLSELAEIAQNADRAAEIALLVRMRMRDKGAGRFIDEAEKKERQRR